MSSDVVHALRALARAPVLAAVVVLSLGVGIGANTVVFSWIQAMVLRPLPGVADASSFHLVEPRTDGGVRPGASWLEYQDLARGVSALTDLTAFRMVPFNVGDATRSERTYGLLVSGTYFPALRLQPWAGRLLRPDDASTPGGGAVAVLSHAYAETQFGAAGAAVGQRLRVNDVALTVVGVTPPAFQGTVLGLQFDLWVPATLAPVLLSGSGELEDRRLRGYYVMGRAADAAAAAQARREVEQTMAALARAYPESNARLTADVLPFWRASRGPQGLLLQSLGVLQGVMLLLLAAVWGNTANLVLARAAARQRDFGVRLAVGAGWPRVIRLLVIEQLLLGVAGAAVGVGLAMWGSTALRAVPLLTTQVPVRFQTGVDPTGLAVAVLLGVLGAVVCAAAPAWHLARVDVATALRANAAGAPRRAMRHLLMAIQVALAATVLMTAALFLESFRAADRVDPGFQPDGVLLAAYDLTGRGGDAASHRQFAARILGTLRRVPDVQAAAIASSMPLDIHGLPSRSFALEGRVRVEEGADRVLSNTVTPGYFRTMNIPILAGSDFAALDDTAAPEQAVVNVAFVRRYIAGGSSASIPAAPVGTVDLEAALGRRIEVSGQAFVIHAVVRDSLYESFTEPPTPIVYLSYRDRPSRAGEIHVRTTGGDEALLAAAIRRAVREADAALPIYNVRTLTAHVDMNLALRRIPARMFLVLGPLILLLAAIGIYAVVAYTVAHRTLEIGVRLALGATRERVVGQVVRETLRVVVAGAVVGWLPVAFVYTHLFRGGLDAGVFAGVPMVLVAVAALASWLPARRAGRIDPVDALRAE